MERKILYRMKIVKGYFFKKVSKKTMAIRLDIKEEINPAVAMVGSIEADLKSLNPS